MTPPDQLTSLDQLTAAIERSRDLEGLVDAAWNAVEVAAESRAVAAAGLCALALNHGRSVRILLAEAPPSAIALLRSQYEALVRAVWAHHAAAETDLALLLAPLTLDSQQAARKLPGVTDMLTALQKSGATGAAANLGRARARLWDGLNSFVHGGIHPFQRGESGYPIPLLADLLKNTNAMTMLTLVVLAEITADADVVALMAGLHGEFGDVLPALEPFPA